MSLTHILKRPIITEKSLRDASREVFTFHVTKSATKNQIKQAVERFYSVNVVKVRTTLSRGKSYRVGKTRRTRLKPPVKRARVQLKKGQKIDLFDIEK